MYQLTPVRSFSDVCWYTFFIELHILVIFVLEVSEDLKLMGIKSTI